jgi:metallophosphoesterase (TIGR03767 family)
MEKRLISRRGFLKGTAALTAAIGLPERAWREAWAVTPAGGTTVSRTIVGSGGVYQKLAYGPGEPYLLRENLGVLAQPGRATRRSSLLYFAHISDTHLLDAQSPARFEYLDAIGAASAFRPHEMLTPFVLDSMVRQLNTLETSEMSGVPLAFAINTGDTTDNQQYNELRWVIDVLDGGDLQPRSGGTSYEGVQAGNTFSYYYHPDQPNLDEYGRVLNFPAYPGLLNSAEQGFSAAGLRVPWYAVHGNHDGLVQGNLPALPAFQNVATGSIKLIGFPFGTDQRAEITRDILRGDSRSWKQLLDWASTHQDSRFVRRVTPDPNRRLVSHQQWINEHFNTRGRPSGHGFTAENVAGDIGYYTFDPAAGIHCVVIDTVNPTGLAFGNLDETQFQWLGADLTAHAGMITLVFAHHTIATMNNPLRRNGGKPRLGKDLERLFWANAGVVAFINGHSHTNEVIPHSNPAAPGNGFWEINTTAHVEFPEQSRVIEIFDNADGTLSIFGAMVDHMADPSATSLTPAGLAVISRELSFNDPQWGPSLGAGTPLDRNVELIIGRPGALRRI